MTYLKRTEKLHMEYYWWVKCYDRGDDGKIDSFHKKFNFRTKQISSTKYLLTLRLPN
jgi:hypothetical protein